MSEPTDEQTDEKNGTAGTSTGSRYDADLATCRAALDRIDAAVVYLLAERFSVTEQVGRVKAAAQLPALDAEREAEQRQRRAALARDADVDTNVVEAVFASITAAVRERHDEIRRGNNAGRMHNLVD